MIKPLLRTIPTLSGNVKLACTLLDYNKTSEDGNIIYETNIRGAKLLPLTSSLFQKNLTVSLLNSSWEYDVKKFYSCYSDVFYNINFNYNKNEIEKIDKTSIIYQRNTDFEFGVKRVSYKKSGSQFACFAPIYIDSTDDIPNYLMIDMTFSKGSWHMVKHIKVNIASNKDDNHNYIYKYLSKYVSKLDDKVAYMNNDDCTITYWAIDAVNGGFVKKTDSLASSLFKIQMPIQMFDYNICKGFSNNKIVIKQIIPLCFYIDIENILTDGEKNRYLGADIVFSANYYDSSNNKLDFYDFDWDYEVHNENILAMNSMSGTLEKIPGFSENIMDEGFPSLYDRRISEYQFADTLTATFSRWKMLYSDDDYPYITNMSWAFSNNQGSNYKYREFPVSFTTQAAYAKTTNGKYDLIFPLGEDKSYYDNHNIASAKKYTSIMDNYCLNWFDVVDTDVFNSFKDTVDWKDVNDGYVYYRGMLYNLNYIYNKANDLEDKIDKFSMLVYPDTANIMSSSQIGNLKFVSYVINYDYDKYCINESLVDDLISGTSPNVYNTMEYTTLTGDLLTDSIFVENDNSSDVSFDNPVYANITDLNSAFDYYESSAVYCPIDSRHNAYGNLLNSEEPLTYDQFTSDTRAYLVIDLFTKSQYNESAEFTKYGSSGFNYNQACYYIYLIMYYSTHTDGDTYLDDIGLYSSDEECTIGTYMYEQLPIYYSSVYAPDGVVNEDLKDIVSDLYYCDSNCEYKSIGDYSSSKDIDYSNTKYYNMLYQVHMMISKDYYDILGDINIQVLNSFCMNLSKIGDEFAYKNFNINDINIRNSHTNNLYLVFNTFYSGLKNTFKLTDITTNSNKYEFHPYMENENHIYAKNVVTKMNKNFDRMYGSSLSESQITGDNNYKDQNFLWLSEYNIKTICDNKDIDGFKLFSTLKRSFYAQILNKNHLLKFQYYFYKNCNGANDTTSSPNNRLFKVYKRFTSNNSYIDIKYELIAYDFNNEYKHTEFDSETGMFYKTDEAERTYFTIVEKSYFYPLTESIWKSISINDGDDPEKKWIDLLIYRPFLANEYESKYYKYMTFEKTSTSVDELIDLDEMLYPCFDTPYFQDEVDTLIYTNWILNNISKANLTYSSGVSTTLYRYNCNNELCFIELTEDQYNKLISQGKTFTTYSLYNTEITSYDGSGDTDVLGLFNQFKINTIKLDDGTIYGYYLLKTTLDNTSNTFDIRGFLEASSDDVDTYDDTISELKYITQINGVDITNNKAYVQSLFVQLCPFIYTNLLSYISNLGTVMIPTTFNLNMLYAYYTLNDDNGSDEISIIYSTQNSNIYKKQILQRYTNMITPLITKRTYIPNQYALKFKECNVKLLDTGKYTSIGDSVLYTENKYIDYPSYIKIYGESDDPNVKSYNNCISSYEPTEYKHYNCSKMVNLESTMTYEMPGVLTYEEVLDHENEYNSLQVFKKLIDPYNSMDEDKILFLYKKYEVKYDTTSTGLGISQEYKVYKLIYKFNLL